MRKGYDDVQKYLVMGHEHHYESNTFDRGSLTDRDRLICESMIKANGDEDFSLFLASMGRSVRGSCDPDDNYYDHEWENEPADHHDIDVEIETVNELRHIRRLDGSSFAKSANVEDDSFLHRDMFNDCDPADEEYDGNEEVTHYYRGSCILIMPRWHELDFAFGTTAYLSADFSRWIDSMLQGYASLLGSSVRDELLKLCRMLSAQIRSSGRLTNI